MKERIVVEGKAGTTVKIDTDDTVDNLIDDGGIAMLDSSLKLCIAVTLSIETNSIRFAFTGNPAQDGSLGHLLTVGSFLTLTGASNVRAFQYISATAGNAAVIMATPYYNYGS